MLDHISNRPGRPEKYKFSEMGSGDRAFFPAADIGLRKLQRRLVSAAARHGRFKSRQCVVNGAHGIMMERVKDVT